MNINVNCELLGINEKCLSSSKNLRFLRNAHEQIHGLDCSNGTGWVELPNFVEKAEFANLKQCAKEVQENSDVLLVIGIGGSFLGAYAGISMLKSQPKTEVRFIGNSLDSNDLNEVLAYCKDKQVSVNVISKSGTTMETAVVFEIVEPATLTGSNTALGVILPVLPTVKIISVNLVITSSAGNL